MGALSFKVNGEAYSIDIDAELSILNLEDERSRSASLIANWGIILAEAEANVERFEYLIKHKRAAAKKAMLMKDIKLAEWKADVMVEAEEWYKGLNDQLVDTRELSKKVKVVHDAFLKKHDMLRAVTDREWRPRSGDIGRTDNDPRFTKFREEREKRNNVSR